MKASLSLACLIPVAMVAGCASFGAISGDTSACAGAQHELALARASLTLAQLALTSAEALGSPPAVTTAQTAVNVISADVTSIEALVTTSCTPAPVAHAAMAMRAPTMTLATARKLVKADQAFAEAASLRAAH